MLCRLPQVLSVLHAMLSHTVLETYVCHLTSIWCSHGVSSPLHGGRIAYLIDPDSYTDWSFYTPGRTYKVKQVKGQSSSTISSFFFL